MYMHRTYASLNSCSLRIPSPATCTPQQLPSASSDPRQASHLCWWLPSASTTLQKFSTVAFSLSPSSNPCRPMPFALIDQTGRSTESAFVQYVLPTVLDLLGT
ncbi:hypothetical protein LX36DRAFT_110604 [Colletotrichum falcatum]|nr:hypothetical protein LX36DRAFT_110604 [Colletotrichum falcatum]